MVISEKTYTVDEFREIAHLPENSEKRLELTRGRLSQRAFLDGNLGEILTRLIMITGGFVFTNKCGRLTTASGYILEDATVRAPDVGFISRERAPERLGKGFVPMPPDLAVEIVSPNDKAGEIRAKMKDYIDYGVRLVWFVYPELEAVDVITAQGIQQLGRADTLTGGDVLSGFSLAIASIFDFE